MKAIIFDVDNTLIKWSDDYLWALKKVLNDMGYDSEKYYKLINEALIMHKYKYDTITKENMLDIIKEYSNLDLNEEFLKKFINEQKQLYYTDEDITKTIEYLYKKYDLYVISDWFTETQEGRLENMGILKYFKKVYGADINYCKKNLKAFDVILDKYPSNECVFIGDNYELDVLNPSLVGMNVIWVTNNKSTKYQTINNIKELMNIL